MEEGTLPTETQEEARFTSSGGRLEPEGDRKDTSCPGEQDGVECEQAAEGTAFSRNGLKQPEEPAVGKKENSCVDDPNHQGSMMKVRWFVVYKACGGRHCPARNVSDHINKYKYTYVTNQGLS